jgi:hypothetical protein
MPDKQRSPDSDKLKEQFTRDLAEARKYMEPIQQRMDRDYEAYRNYRNIDDPDFKVSDMYEYVETIVPIVTNNRIRATVHSDYPDYVVHAQGANDILDNTYDINNWDYVSQEIMRDALIYRSCFAYTGFDAKYKNGTGKLCMDPINPRWTLTDPAAPKLQDSRFFFFFQPMRKTQMYKMYPEKKADIDKSVGSNSAAKWNGQQGGFGQWFKSWIGSIKNSLVFNRTATQAKQAYDPITLPEMDESEKYKNVVAYIHYWYRDDDDKWRCSYWADDCLLKDEPNPFWHGMLPYDILSPVKDPMSMLGIPMSDQINSMSYQRNVIMNYIIENSRKHANPEMLWNTTFGNVKDPQRLREEATSTGIIPINNPDMVPMNAIAEYMQPPALPGYVTGLFDQLGATKDAITGVNDSFRGTQQASSGKEVQLQQEAAYTRIKTMIDQFELFNKNIAEKVLINAMQFYTTTRGFRIKGDYRKYDKMQQIAESQGSEMPLEIEKVQTGLDDQGQPTYSKSEFFLYANPNEWTKLAPEGDGDEVSDEAEGEEKESSEPGKEQVEKAFKVLQMTVEIEAGSSLPQSRLARREEASELFSAGAIDQEALLDSYDWPDREEIMKRMREQAQQQQEAQAQAAQAEAQANMQLEQQKMQADMAKTQANNAQLQKQQLTNKGQIAEQGLQNTGNGLAGVLDQVRQQFPQIANLPDDQIIAIISGQQQAG